MYYLNVALNLSSEKLPTKFKKLFSILGNFHKHRN